MSDIDKELELQESIINEQDNSLEKLGKTISQLKQISITINTELDNQEYELISLEKDVDKTTIKLDKTSNKITDLLKNNKSCCITWFILALLFILLLIFLFIFFYT